MVKFRSGTAVLSEQWIAPYPVRMDRQQGTVKWFSRDKGWGFVRLEDGSEIFVHHSDIEGDGRKTLEDGERIEFSVEQLEKGPRARDVKRLGASPGSPGGSNRRRRGSGRGRGRSTAGQAAVGQPTTAPDKATVPDRPASLAEQLRSRLARLFPGIGT